MASHSRQSDNDGSDYEDFPQGQEGQIPHGEPGLDSESDQTRLLRRLNDRLDQMQQNQVLQNDRMRDLVSKMDGGDEIQYEWQKKSHKIQFQTAQKVFKKCRLASVAMKPSSLIGPKNIWKKVLNCFPFVLNILQLLINLLTVGRLLPTMNVKI